MPDKLDDELFKKYQKYILTPEELKAHLYPNKEYPIYADFYELQHPNNEPEQKNKILIIDCEMVVSAAGFELARATIVNFSGEVIFD